jgi:hypothetical protein
MIEELREVAGRVPSLIWSPGNSPIEQASRWVPERMYQWQVDTLRDCMVRGSQVSVVTPNESGKTSVVIPVLGLSWMAAFPGSMVVSTAGVERQIKEQLWPVLRQTLAPHDQWQITDGLTIRAPSVRGWPGSKWEAFTTKDPDYAEGWHPRWYRNKKGELVYAPLLIIVDEAKSFDDEEMMFAFVNRCDPDCIIQISTPGEEEGPFYDSLHKDKAEWKTRWVEWEDCPHLREGPKLAKRLREIEKRGADHPLVRSWIFGKFYRKGARYIFSRMEDAEHAISGQVPWERGNRRIAIEFSGGGDEQVIGFRDGNRVMPLECFHEKDDVRFADICVERFKKWHVTPNEIVADNGGAGKPVIDILQSRGYPGIWRYNFNAAPQDKTAYGTRAMEDHDELSTKLAQQCVILPDDPKLIAQMRKRKYLIKNDSGVMWLEPKEVMRNHGGGSPDRLDNVVMLTSDMPPVDFSRFSPETAKAAAEMKKAICGDYRDCFKKASGGGSSQWASSGPFEEDFDDE